MQHNELFISFCLFCTLNIFPFRLQKKEKRGKQSVINSNFFSLAFLRTSDFFFVGYGSMILIRYSVKRHRPKIHFNTTIKELLTRYDILYKPQITLQCINRDTHTHTFFRVGNNTNKLRGF